MNIQQICYRTVEVIEILCDCSKGQFSLRHPQAAPVIINSLTQL